MIDSRIGFHKLPIVPRAVARCSERTAIPWPYSNESLRLEVADGEIHYDVTGTTSGAEGSELEGPVLRGAGVLEQGLLPGVEHLGHNEASSTTLDLPLPDAIRFEPQPLLVTIPMAALVTDRGSLAMLWEDPTLQPIFASPDFLDGRADHRVSLRGPSIQATIRVAGSWDEGERLERAVEWSVVRRGGLPPLPEIEMDREAIKALLLQGFDESGIHAGEHRYYHAVLPGLKTLPEDPHPITIDGERVRLRVPAGAPPGEAVVDGATVVKPNAKGLVPLP